MNRMMKNLAKDLEDYNLPCDENAFDKIKCSLEPGERIYWYYKEDLKFWEEEEWTKEKNFSPKNYGGIYCGIVVPKQDTEIRGGELDVEDCVVIIIDYPCEKCYPSCDWVALKRLIDNEDLVEIIN